MAIRLLTSLVAFSLCSPGFSDEIPLGFINATLDSDEVGKLTNLSRDELLETLIEDFEVEVVVMPFAAGASAGGSPIQLPQTEAHRNAATLFLKTEKLNLAGVNASLLSPYRMALTPIGEPIDRPFADKYVMIVSRNANRAVILHEALHLLIDRKRARKSEHGPYQGRDVHLLDVVQVERVKLRMRYEKNPKSLSNADLIRMAELEMLLMERSHAEELALYTFEMENEEKLKLPKEFLKNEFEGFKHVTKMVADMIAFSYKAVRSCATANEQEKKRINALMTKFEWWHSKGLPSASTWIEKHEMEQAPRLPLLPALNP